MILAFIILLFSCPAGAAAALAWARTSRLRNPSVHAALGAVFPVYGAFCALNYLMKD